VNWLDIADDNPNGFFFAMESDDMDSKGPGLPGPFVFPRFPDPHLQ